MKSFAVLLTLAVVSQDCRGFNQRIVGGGEAVRGEAPWQVLILRQDNVLKPFCAGSLISREWVLTSGQCAYGSNNLTLISGRNYLVSGDQGEGSDVQSPKTVIIHPNYNPNGGSQGDIALMQIQTPIHNTQFIRPLRLPRPSQVAVSFAGVTARMFGWGVTSDIEMGLGILNRPLKMVDMPVITNQDCAAIYAEYVHDRHICTSGVTGGSICERDQGGALVLQESDGQWTQVGVASYFDSLSCEAKHPSGFTRVSSYVDWIYTHTGIRSTEPVLPDFLDGAAAGDVPSAVSVWAIVKNVSHASESNGAIPFCTGAILSGSHVIVSGSCLDAMDQPAVPLVDRELAAGVVKTSEVTTGRVKVNNVIRYGPVKVRDTVAILRTAVDFNLNATSTTALVETTMVNITEGTACIVSGWRHYPTEVGVAGYLTLANVTIRPQSECTVRSKTGYSTICAKPLQTATCVPPQEGSLLICNGRLAGLYSSMEETTPLCSDPRHFLEVKQFNDWINKQMNGGGGTGGGAGHVTPPTIFIALAFMFSILRA